MKTLLYTAISLYLLTGCATPRQNFERMTASELFEYNRSVGVMDQVYCTEDIRTGSYIRKRSCAKYSEVISGHIGTLDIPSSSTSYTYGVQ